MGFAYDKCYWARLSIVLYEILNRRPYARGKEYATLGPKLVLEDNKKVRVIKGKLKVVKSRYKSYIE